MINSVNGTIEKFNLLQNGDKVIIALSGGADSVALLDILNSIKEKYNLTLYAAHLNHGLRGEEADRDESFCKILCKNYNIELFVKHINIGMLANQQKISEELCGRNERYSFFEELSGSLGAKTATAHTASDNAETLIFNLARGSSVAGASAIPPRRQNIIRPLIEQTRADIEAYCAAHGLDFVTDSTNLSDDYTRNKIRHSVISALKQINPSFEKAALRFSQSAAETADFLNEQANSAIKKSVTEFGYSAQSLLSNHAAVQKAAIARICLENSFVPEQKHIALIIEILKNGGAVDLSEGLTAVCRQGIFRITAKANEKINLEIPFGSKVEYRGRTINAEIDNSVLENKALVFRTRRSGDTFTFPKRNVTKPLRRAMQEQKIPSEQRDSILALCEGSIVLWCEGVGLSAQGIKYNLKIKEIEV